jgi:hypothetical protein
VLYSLIFVTQPLNAISPIDQKFFELIVPIATFLTGTLSGIMLAGGDKESQRKALELANRTTTVSPAPVAPVTPTQLSPTAFAMPAASMPPVTPPFMPSVTLSSAGKPMPVQPPQPEL